MSNMWARQWGRETQHLTRRRGACRVQGQPAVVVCEEGDTDDLARPAGRRGIVSATETWQDHGLPGEEEDE